MTTTKALAWSALPVTLAAVLWAFYGEPSDADLMLRIQRGYVQRPRPVVLSKNASTSAPALQRAKKFYVRPCRTYIGPVPTPKQLAFYITSGLSDAFASHVRVEYRDSIDSGMLQLLDAMDRLGDDIDRRIEEAKTAVRATDDEYVVLLRDPSAAHRRNEVSRIKSGAQKAGDLVVTETVGDREHHFRLRRERFKDLYVLKAEETDAIEACRGLLHDLTKAVLLKYGSKALDAILLERAASRSDARKRQAAESVSEIIARPQRKS